MPPKKRSAVKKVSAAKRKSSAAKPSKPAAGKKPATPPMAEAEPPAPAPRPPTPPADPIAIGFKAMQSELVEDNKDRWRQTARYPLLIDPAGRSSVYFEYRAAVMVDPWSKADIEPERLRSMLVGAMRFGKSFVFVLHDNAEQILDLVVEAVDKIEPGLFQRLVSKELVQGQNFRGLVRKDDGAEYEEHLFREVHKEFHVLFIQQAVTVDERLRNQCLVYCIE